MSDISLEKIDVIRDRTGVSYTEAKEALEACDGNVVDALVYIENNGKNKNNIKEEMYTTKEEFVSWLKDIIKKGNVNRILIKKDDKVVVDIPVNAGVAASIIALAIPSLAVIGVLTAVFTKITVEIVRSDGSVEVVNKIIKDRAYDVKEKVSDLTSEIKEKLDKKDSNKFNKDDDNMYQYTVNFEDANEDKDKEDKDKDKEKNTDDR